MKTLLYILFLSLMIPSLIACTDSLYWSRLNTVEDIIRNPAKMRQIIESSQFYCQQDTLLSDLIMERIAKGKYNFYNEKYGLLERWKYEKGEYLNPDILAIHYIKLRSSIDSLPDYSFLFEEENGEWCLKHIVNY